MVTLLHSRFGRWFCWFVRFRWRASWRSTTTRRSIFSMVVALLYACRLWTISPLKTTRDLLCQFDSADRWWWLVEPRHFCRLSAFLQRLFVPLLFTKPFWLGSCRLPHFPAFLNHGSGFAAAGSAVLPCHR